MPIFGEQQALNQFSGQFSYVQGLPDGLGWLSESRVAMRVYGAVGLPNKGLYFPLGGAGLFRGFDLAERQGSLVWVGSAEWRVPLVRHLRCDCLDHTVGLREIWGATFYDAGNAYVSGHALGDVAHALGVGLGFDVAWFSFVERTMIRLDVAQTINSSAPLQFNFYFQQPF
jgi:hemolysin activation/secretion protein